MKVYIIVDDENAYFVEESPIVCSNKADAEEILLSLLEEDMLDSFNYLCQDDEEEFCCVPSRVLPWEDEFYVNCKQCDRFMCKKLKEILNYYDLISFNHYQIIETELT